jgi:hypothetical protein
MLLAAARHHLTDRNMPHLYGHIGDYSTVGRPPFG